MFRSAAKVSSDMHFDFLMLFGNDMAKAIPIVLVLVAALLVADKLGWLAQYATS
jgi:hypothetical protein